MEKIVKKERLDIMLDMETCALCENAAILSMALVPFDLGGGECAEPSLYYVIDGNSCFMEGMKYDDATQVWWQQQDPVAKAAILYDTTPTTIRPVIADVYGWLAGLCETHEVHMWCRGLNFDIPKLEWCFKKFMEKEPPYKYYNMEDARTYCHAFGIHSSDFRFDGHRHTAMDDCKFQIKQVQAAYGKYRELVACKEMVESKA